MPTLRSRRLACRAAAALLVSCLCACRSVPPTTDPRAPPEQAIERMPVHCLERIYLRCSQEALERRMGSSEAAACSLVYEALLKNRFGGDFHALLAWSRAQPQAAAGAGGYERCW